MYSKKWGSGSVESSNSSGSEECNWAAVEMFEEFVNNVEERIGSEELFSIIGELNEMTLRSGKTYSTKKRGGGLMKGGKCTTYREFAAGGILLAATIISMMYGTWTWMACGSRMLSDASSTASACRAIYSMDKVIGTFLDTWGQITGNPVELIKTIVSAIGTWVVGGKIVGALGTIIHYFCKFFKALKNDEPIEDIKPSTKEFKAMEQLVEEHGAELTRATSSHMGGNNSGIQTGGSYNYIVNPETGRKVNVTGKLGKQILKNYLKFI